MNLSDLFINRRIPFKPGQRAIILVHLRVVVPAALNNAPKRVGTDVTENYFALENHDYFSKLEGSKHIATLTSQRNLENLLNQFKPKAILDWGSGIGTLINLAHKVCDPKLYAFEENKYCRGLAKINLAGLPVEYVSEASIPAEIEGVFLDGEISNLQINRLLASKNLKFIFIEGWRNKTVIEISRQLKKHGYAAKFKRPGGWLSNYTKPTGFEKGGAWFIIEKSNRPKAFISRLKRIKSTGAAADPIVRAFFALAAGSYKIRHPKSSFPTSKRERKPGL